MHDKRVALVTGANQGVGLQVAKELVAHGLTVLVGSRNFERGEAAAKEIGPGAIALQLDVTDRVFDRRRGGAHPQGARPPRLARQQRGYLEYEKGRLVPPRVRQDYPPEQRVPR